jgi:hypothetical protein
MDASGLRLSAATIFPSSIGAVVRMTENVVFFSAFPATTTRRT